MVRAILDGEKTQTRRPIRPAPEPATAHPDCWAEWERLESEPPGCWLPWWHTPDGRGGEHVDRGRLVRCHYGVPGDRLWVREAHALATGHMYDRRATVRYRADGAEITIDGAEATNAAPRSAILDRWRPSIHLPRWAARLWLEVTDIRVERVQDITGADVLAEGIGAPWDGRGIAAAGGMTTEIERALRDRWRATWCRHYGAHDWAQNPWVWVVRFEVTDG